MCQIHFPDISANISDLFFLCTLFAGIKHSVYEEGHTLKSGQLLPPFKFSTELTTELNHLLFNYYYLFFFKLDENKCLNNCAISAARLSSCFVVGREAEGFGLFSRHILNWAEIIAKRLPYGTQFSRGKGEDFCAEIPF